MIKDVPLGIDMIAGIETYKNRPTRAEISFENLRNNLSIVKSFIDEHVKIMAVVKANAYGHGIYEISNELIKQGVDYLGVAVLEEGVYLRQHGFLCWVLSMSIKSKSSLLMTLKLPVHPLINRFVLPR
jgi:alanine racemase